MDGGGQPFVGELAVGQRVAGPDDGHHLVGADRLGRDLGPGRVGGADLHVGVAASQVGDVDRRLRQQPDLDAGGGGDRRRQQRGERLPEWAVTVTLLRDGGPVLTVVRQPAGDLTYTAARGAGAYLNGRPLRASAKTDLDAAIAATGQAEADQRDTYRRIGESITALLGRALLVRTSVPSTFPMLLVAAGHADLFWQYEPVLPGVAAGALLITEAGGTVSRIDGSAWGPGSPDILAAAPGLHQAAADALTAVG